MRRVDLLVAEIGSTTTVVSAFDGLNTANPTFVGQGQALTTVREGDVVRGLESAIADLRGNLRSLPGRLPGEHQDDLQWSEMYASSSAAGGLRMSVHGLVYDMTVRAAKEAALGAGAIVKLVTAGKLGEEDLSRIAALRPNMILLAGGVDYGEKETVSYNARQLAAFFSREKLAIPVLYAGNTAAAGEVQAIFQEKVPGMEMVVVENVYPKIDLLNVGPSRRAIQVLFEKHIVSAPGMNRIRSMVKGPIRPTPGAVMQAAQVLYEEAGDLLVLDVGGATTDVHSVTEGSPEWGQFQAAPEPLAKRTVEGDLGVYANAANLYNLLVDRLKAAGTPQNEVPPEEWLQKLPPVPVTDQERRMVEMLTAEAVRVAVERHAGEVRQLYGPAGRSTLVEGKDLTQVKWIIGTGGALTRMAAGRRILESLRVEQVTRRLFPLTTARVVIDEKYLMAPLGVMSEHHPREARQILRQLLNPK
ncbi:MAG: GlmL-related ornithine degradation protein [Syntrophothermus sp.]